MKKLFSILLITLLLVFVAASALADPVCEVTVGDVTTQYDDFDTAFRAADKNGQTATIKLLSTVEPTDYVYQRNTSN